jgi:hypothetical protein
MDNVVKFPDAPEWEFYLPLEGSVFVNAASVVDARMLDWLIVKGYLQHRQRRDWRAVEVAVNNAFSDIWTKAHWHKLGELVHEIERHRRRINSDEEKDRRDLLERFIAGHERVCKSLRRQLIGDPAAENRRRTP